MFFGKPTKNEMEDKKTHTQAHGLNIARITTTKKEKQKNRRRKKAEESDREKETEKHYIYVLLHKNRNF